jgi:hypothetical protein
MFVILVVLYSLVSVQLFWGASTDYDVWGNMQDDLNKRIASIIASNPVMLFMKGNPDAPRCGFSSKVLFRVYMPHTCMFTCKSNCTTNSFLKSTN